MIMKPDKDLNGYFTRRAIVVGGVQGLLLGILASRLAWLQVIQGDRYKTLSNKNRINIKMLAPSRGELLDRRGHLLATNEQNFRVAIIPEQTEDLRKSLDQLKRLIEISEKEIEAIIARAKRSASFVPIEVKDNLTWEEVARVEVNLPDLPGLGIEVGDVRHYPLGAATSHLIGYVGAVNKNEIGKDPLLALPDFKIGKTGAEKYYDLGLRGSAGTAEVEVNVRGREVRELKRTPGKPGKDIKLTIDSVLQQYVQKRLSTEISASAVVMDAHQGCLYALASVPAFDPNIFTRGISADQWEELLADPGLPLNSKGVGGQYPPGSTFKMVTAMAALEKGVMTKDTTVFCPGHYELGGQRFHCWKKTGHGRLNVVGALAESCDTFFYKVSTDVGIDTIAKYARLLGLGQKLGVELNEERPGLIPDRAWKSANFGESWQQGETLVAGIGQGYVLSTPLQLATMTARLVNGGHAVRPWITGAVDLRKTRHLTWPKLNLRPENLDIVVKGMMAVTGSPRGTAAGAQIRDERFLMGGKTGTSQVKRISMADRRAGIDNSTLPWKFRHHALFVGYAPVQNPRYVCCVVVEHGGGGSAVAAPIARDILHQAQLIDPAAIEIVPGAALRDRRQAQGTDAAGGNMGGVMDGVMGGGAGSGTGRKGEL